MLMRRARPATGTLRIVETLSSRLQRCKMFSTTSSRAEESSTVRRAGTVLFTGLVGTTATLCGWQLQRYGWKLELIEQRRKALGLAPRDIHDVCLDPGKGLQDGAEFTPVTCEGRFDHEQQILVGPRSAPPGTESGSPPGAPAPAGWDVITPFTLTDGSRVLVNRGWVPRDATGRIERPAGKQRVRGVLKSGDKENKYGFNDAASRRYVWLDLIMIAESTDACPLLIAATREEPTVVTSVQAAPGWPRERLLSSFMNFYVEPSTHLVYAATWASLTVAGAMITFKRFIR